MKREHLKVLMLCLALSGCGDDGGEAPSGDGSADGAGDGSADGSADGDGDGSGDGSAGGDGAADGDADASADGDGDGSADGDAGGGADGDVDGSADGDGGAGGDGDAGSGGATTFTRVYQILSSNCSPCHTQNNAGNLDMSSKATAYGELVEQTAQGPACGETGRVRVVPGDAAGSLLSQKLRGIDLCGDRMPRNRPALSDSLLEEIEAWIEAGAEDD